MGVSNLEAVQEEEVSLEDARRTIAFLKEAQKAQARSLIAWKTKYKHENASVTKMKKKRDEQLKSFQSQLMIFEAYLRKSKLEFENLLKYKEDIIKRQHQLICSLAIALVKRGGQHELNTILPGIQTSPSSTSSTLERRRKISKTNTINEDDEIRSMEINVFPKSDVESMNDTDSAIMMEDAYDSLIVLPTEKGEARVMRSVSDALELHARSCVSSMNSPRKITSNCHGSLSSTPSGSSEESDESPPSTISKGRCELNKSSTDSNINFPKLEDFSDLLSMGFHSCKSPSCLSSRLQSSSSFSSSGSSTNSSALDNPYLPYTCDNQCQLSIYDSNSTTPLVTPAESPASTPAASPLVVHHHRPPSEVKKEIHDYDSDATLSDGEYDHKNLDAVSTYSELELIEKRIHAESYIELNDYELTYIKKQPRNEINQVTYNRVMSNHRSVTKPKDVKYKRINKAKSRSLEELRGKLKLWNINKQTCIAIDLGQSDA